MARPKKQVEPIEEAAKGTLHRVRYSHDDSSGNGIASGNLSLYGPIISPLGFNISSILIIFLLSFLRTLFILLVVELLEV